MKIKQVIVSAITVVLMGLVSVKLFAFPCFITLAKDSCWTNYDVSVQVMDPVKNKEIIAITIPKGKSWGRGTFSCEPGQKVFYLATFQPVFWQSDVGKNYQSVRYWFFPDVVKPEEKAWNVSVCYPSDFSGVPLPPDAKGNCQCDFSSIPTPTL